MSTALPTLLTSLALNSLSLRRVSPDHTVAAFLENDHPVPFVTSDEALGGDPRGLLLWAANARAAGYDRYRCHLVHPSLPYSVPRVERGASRLIARAGAVIVAESDSVSQAVLVLDGEGSLHALPCAQVPFAPLASVTAQEASRELRQIVMHGLDVVERSGDATPLPVRDFGWRDWQAEMTGAGLRKELVQFLPDTSLAAPLSAALDVHESMSSVLAPATVEPPELGAALAALHPAAAEVVLTVSRASGDGVA